MCYNRVRIFACEHETSHIDYCNQILRNRRATCSITDDVVRMRQPCSSCASRAMSRTFSSRPGDRLPGFVLPSIEQDSDSDSEPEPVPVPRRRRQSSLHSRMNRMNIGTGSGSDSDNPRLRFSRMRLNSHSGSDNDRRHYARAPARNQSPPRRHHRGRRSNADPSGGAGVHFGRSRSPARDRDVDTTFHRYRSPPRRDIRRELSPPLFRGDFNFGPGRQGGRYRPREYESRGESASDSESD